jgi:hypothetical protein
LHNIVRVGAGIFAVSLPKLEYTAFAMRDMRSWVKI